MPNTAPGTAAARDAPRRLRASAGRVVQAAVAAAVSWYLAGLLLQQPQTVFAPIAAVVVLLGGTGGRARRGVQVAVGVGVGVLVGEMLVGLLDRGPLSVALGAGTAMLLVALVYTDELPIIQAGVAVAIIVTADSPASGIGRLLAALLGVAVALLFTQVLLTPSPVRVLEKSIDDALHVFDGAFTEVAAAVRAGRDVPESTRDGLIRAGCGLADARARARSMSRRTVRGRRQAARVDACDDRARRVAVLVDDLVALRRGATDPDADRRLAELGATAHELVTRPRPTR